LPFTEQLGSHGLLKVCSRYLQVILETIDALPSFPTTGYAAFEGSFASRIINVFHFPVVQKLLGGRVAHVAHFHGLRPACLETTNVGFDAMICRYGKGSRQPRRGALHPRLLARNRLRLDEHFPLLLRCAVVAFGTLVGGRWSRRSGIRDFGRAFSHRRGYGGWVCMRICANSRVS